MRKAPYRPRTDNGITQCYNDGIITVYAVANAAEAGYKPKEKLAKKIILHYEERRMGIQRYYSAQQNQTQIERVIRVPAAGNISSQDVVITEDGRQYRIDLVQSVAGVYPASVDLTLSKLMQNYEELENDMV